MTLAYPEALAQVVRREAAAAAAHKAQASRAIFSGMTPGPRAAASPAELNAQARAAVSAAAAYAATPKGRFVANLSAILRDAIDAHDGSRAAMAEAALACASRGLETNGDLALLTVTRIASTGADVTAALGALADAGFASAAAA